MKKSIYYYVVNCALHIFSISRTYSKGVYTHTHIFLLREPAVKETLTGMPLDLHAQEGVRNDES